jgi:hypothetical protein
MKLKIDIPSLMLELEHVRPMPLFDFPNEELVTKLIPAILKENAVFDVTSLDFDLFTTDDLQKLAEAIESKITNDNDLSRFVEHIAGMRCSTVSKTGFF